MPVFYGFSGGLVQRDDSRLLKPGDLSVAIGGEMRPGSDSIFTTGYRKTIGTLGSGEHILGSPLFAQHDAAAASRIVAGVAAALFEAEPKTTGITSSQVQIDAANLAYASAPKALVGKQTAEKLFVASGVGVNVTIDTTAFSPRRQNLIRKADTTWMLMSLIPPSEPPEVARSAVTLNQPTGSVTSNSGWANTAKATDTDDNTRAYAIASASTPSRTVVFQFITAPQSPFTALNHKVKILHSTATMTTRAVVKQIVGAGGSQADPGTSSMKVELSLDSGSTFVTISNKPAPYDAQWTDASIPNGTYTTGQIRVRVTLTFVASTTNVAGYLNTVKVTNAPAVTSQSAPNGFRYVITEWDDTNSQESAWSAESEVVSDTTSPTPPPTTWNVVTVKLPPGMTTPGQRQNNRTTHWRVYRQPEGAAAGEFDKYGLVAEIPIFKSASQTVTNAVTSGGLIKLTVTAHGYATGNRVLVQNVGGVPAATGMWTITVVDANSFTLDGSTFSGTFTTGGTVQAFNTEFVDQFEKPLTDVARPTLRALVTGQGSDLTFYPKDAPHALYKSIDIFKESVVGVPVDDPSNVYFSPPGEYESRPSLYRIPSRTVRNDSAVGVKTLDDILVIFFEGWSKRVQHLPLVINGLFDPSNAAEASVTRGAAGPLAFDDFTMPNESGSRWICAADREGVYITNGYAFLPWTNNINWQSNVELGKDSNGDPYLARTVVKNHPDKRRIEVYYVGAGDTGVSKRIDFYYGEGDMRQDDGQPRVWGPHPSKARGVTNVIITTSPPTSGQRQRFTSTDGSVSAGRICWEDADSYFSDDSVTGGSVTRTLTTGDLPITVLGQNGYLRQVALRTIKGVYQAITETISMEYSSGEKRTVAGTQDPNAPAPTGVLASGETFQYTADDSGGGTEKTTILGLYVESKPFGREGSALNAAVGASAGTTSLPTS